VTAARAVETTALAIPTPTSREVARVVDPLPSVDLPTLDARAALLTRVDRKYVVPLSTFEHLVRSLGDGWRILEIDRRRLFGYASVYFDTPDFLTYRAHLQGRRRRFKVRVRRYVDSDDCMLEVKTKGLRGVTVKHRQAHPGWSQDRLGDAGRAFVDSCVQDFCESGASDRMRPVVTTANRRATLTDLGAQARMTVDFDLATGHDDSHSVLRPGYVLLESKVAGHGSEVDRRLRALGVRPIAVSKYCIGVASLGSDLPSNPWHRTMRSFFDAPLPEES
jgi:hypothetical protein